MVLRLLRIFKGIYLLSLPMLQYMEHNCIYTYIYIYNQIYICSFTTNSKYIQWSQNAQPIQSWKMDCYSQPPEENMNTIVSHVSAECSPLFLCNNIALFTAMDSIIVSYYVILKVLGLGVYNQKRVLLCS